MVARFESRNVFDSHPEEKPVKPIPVKLNGKIVGQGILVQGGIQCEIFDREVEKILSGDTVREFSVDNNAITAVMKNKEH